MAGRSLVADCDLVCCRLGLVLKTQPQHPSHGHTADSGKGSQAGGHWGGWGRVSEGTRPRSMAADVCHPCPLLTMGWGDTPQLVLMSSHFLVCGKGSAPDTPNPGTSSLPAHVFFPQCKKSRETRVQIPARLAGSGCTSTSATLPSWPGGGRSSIGDTMG